MTCHATMRFRLQCSCRDGRHTFCPSDQDAPTRGLGGQRKQLVFLSHYLHSASAFSEAPRLTVSGESIHDVAKG